MATYTPNPLNVVGNIAHNVADGDNPLKVGGVARTTNPTAVANGNRVNGSFDVLGRQIVIPQQVRNLVQVQYTTTAITTTAETTIIAAAAGTFHDLCSIVAINSSGSAVRVDFRDTSAGTVRFSLFLPAGDTRGFVLQVPYPQGAVNTNWTAQLSVGVTDVRIFAQAVKNV